MLGLSPEQIGAAIVGLLLAFEGWNNRKRRRSVPPGQHEDLVKRLAEIRNAVNEIQAVVCARDGENRLLAHFPHAAVDRAHEKQTDMLQQIASDVRTK